MRTLNPVAVALVAAQTAGAAHDNTALWPDERTRQEFAGDLSAYRCALRRELADLQRDAATASEAPGLSWNDPATRAEFAHDRASFDAFCRAAEAGAIRR